MAIAEPAIRDRLTTELFSTDDVRTEPAHGYEPHAVIGGGADGAPLVLMPVHNHRAGAATLLRWTDATTRREAARRFAGWAGIRSGVALRARPRIFVRTISTDRQTFHEHLAKVLDLPRVSLTASFGPPRPNQKPVVRIFGESGETQAFAKVGWNALTRALVDGEAEFLRTGTASLRTIAAPSIVSNDPWNGRSIAVMPALAGNPPVGRPPKPAKAMLEEVAGLSDRYWATIGESPYRAALKGTEQGAARQALELIDTRWSDLAVPFGHWHGDWTPWNMRHVGNRLIVWDWERNAPHVPLAFDSIHYEFQSRAVAEGHRFEVLLAAVQAAAEPMRSLGVLDATLPAMTTLYLIELDKRFSPATEDEPEASASHRAEVTDLLRDAVAHFSA